MKGFIQNLESLTQSNSHFREVLYTAQSSQLVIMNLKPSQEIGEEVHHLDQFLYFVSGSGIVQIDDNPNSVSAGFGVVVPAGAKHNVINNSDEVDLKIFTVYSPPEHKDGTIHITKPENEDPEDHFDGQTTE